MQAVATVDENQINSIYGAYKNGQMNPDEKMQYESDVNNGLIQTPYGVTLNQKEVNDAPIVDAGVLNAYKTKNMSREDMIQFEDDVSKGLWQLPENETVGKTEPLGFFGSVKEMFTGEDRTTEEIKNMPDWGGMPEINSFSFAGAKASLGTLLSNPDETVKVIKANFPNTEVRKDAKGNYIMKSSIDGKEYAIHAGFQPSDIPRAAAGLMAFTPAGGAKSLIGAAAAGGATQAGIEATQAATGGEFDAVEIPIAGALGAAGQVASRAIGGVVDKTKEGVNKFLTNSELSDVTRKAATGSFLTKNQSIKTLAEQAAPDAEILQAAKRLGIDEWLQPDHVTTNQAYRELSQAVKSVPASSARVAEIEGLEQVAKKADDIIEELGGTVDLSSLDESVKTRMSNIQNDLYNQSEKLYDDLSKNIPDTAPAKTDNIVNYLNEEAEKLGGVNFLSPFEKEMLRNLSPRQKTVNKVKTEILPTYARLDKIRKNIGEQLGKKADVYPNASNATLKKFYNLLLEDQQAVAEKYGQKEIFDMARKTVAIRKGLEDDTKALFGREINKTMLTNLSDTFKSLATGDVNKFVKLLKVIPNESRKEVVASGLNVAFGKNAANGKLNFRSYANWYEGLKKNKVAYNALMTNLPEGAERTLSDLYKVSNGIRQASKERITTGRLQSVRDELRGADTLISNIYDLAKRSSTGLAVEAVATPLGFSGAGIVSGISSALSGQKPNVLKAADELIASPEFINLAKNISDESVKKFSKTSKFNKFYNLAIKDKKMTSKEKFALSLIQTERQDDGRD